MPLNGFPCPVALLSKSIAWVQGNFDLTEILAPFGIQPSSIKNAHFPPIIDSKFRYHRLTAKDSWFICNASSEAESESIFRRMNNFAVLLDYNSFVNFQSLMIRIVRDKGFPVKPIQGVITQ